jgi:hypothetical protein
LPSDFLSSFGDDATGRAAKLFHLVPNSLQPSETAAPIGQPLVAGANTSERTQCRINAQIVQVESHSLQKSDDGKLELTRSALPCQLISYGVGGMSAHRIGDICHNSDPSAAHSRLVSILCGRAAAAGRIMKDSEPENSQPQNHVFVGKPKRQFRVREINDLAA